MVTQLDSGRIKKEPSCLVFPLGDLPSCSKCTSAHPCLGSGKAGEENRDFSFGLSAPGSLETQVKSEAPKLDGQIKT